MFTNAEIRDDAYMTTLVSLEVLGLMNGFYQDGAALTGYPEYAQALDKAVTAAIKDFRARVAVRPQCQREAAFRYAVRHAFEDHMPGVRALCALTAAVTLNRGLRTFP
jgi:hypothetical protein